jgi:hypothetical protein
LANQLDLCDEKEEPKSAANVYNYNPIEDDAMIDDFDQQRDRALSKVSINDDNFY